MAIGEKEGYGYFDRYGGFKVTGDLRTAETMVELNKGNNPRGIIPYTGEFEGGYPLIGGGKVKVIYNGPRSRNVPYGTLGKTHTDDRREPLVELARYEGEGGNRSSIINWSQNLQREAKAVLKSVGIDI